MENRSVAQLVADDLTALAIRRSKERIAALEAEVKALEDEILDCPAERYHTRDRPR